MPVYAGHASTQDPEGLLVPANLLHVVAMSLWAGGLVALLAVLPAATRRLEPPDRSRLLPRPSSRFSALALAAVLTIVVTGLIQAYVYVRSVDNLLHTAFGRAVLIKMVLLLGLIALGAYNRRRSVPRLQAVAAEGASTGQTGVLLRRALRAEVGLIVVVLGVTAALTSYAPSIAAQSGPFSATRDVGPAQLQITIDPARVGANQMHLYLINPKDGTQFTGAKEVDVAETQPGKGIGPLSQKAALAGPGHYIVPGRAADGARHLEGRGDRPHVRVRRVPGHHDGQGAMRNRATQLLVVLAGVGAVVALTALGGGALHVAPGLALFVLLALGRYPGETAISRPLARIRARRRRSPASPPAPRRRPLAGRMTGREIAMAMAGRGPPRRSSVPS